MTQWPSVCPAAPSRHPLVRYFMHSRTLCTRPVPCVPRGTARGLSVASALRRVVRAVLRQVVYLN